MGVIAVAVALTVASQGAIAAGRSCHAVEEPAAPGVPHVLIPAGAIPQTGPLEIVDQLRRGRAILRIGFGPPREITCVRFVPPTDRCSAGQSQSCGRWHAHVEAPFWFRPPLSQGSCRARNGMVTLPDGDLGPSGGSLFDSDCSSLRHLLRKGR